eukprot:CAMPEP_0172539972 /NCGR_PEP_ID=MMETSP1067-20121228/11068_1 /TAXON_ID=265564 ORGANISM="Thalassiosira punctigera, Strain Tpunct2005C2" /NCGR_SAMPLE_ID=MMETSP1067 /ASSEMBLY_ACC=CAM_ASM_000444 /LENGTH=448 /DNA_ID=CAMNT_0013325741 /DNA_START=146 /DNA_END=1492 /DNA_ORIENTATION=+
MNRAALSILTIISTASLLVTLFLANITANYDTHRSDALSFEAPHLQHSGNNNSSMLKNGNDASPRRNLSEVEDSTNDENNIVGTGAQEGSQQISRPFTSSHRKGSKMNDKQQVQQQQQQQQEQSKNKDNRPSGVVYEYIAPPPINLTARYQLSAKFPNLADLDTASTSTALCGIVKDAEPYLDEWADYHFGLGFHTIYLIDNSKEHELRNWQNKRRNAGYSVRVLPKPGSHRQMYGYHMCAAEHKQDHTYMAFFDVDEFLVLKKHETIDEMLQQHLPRGSLAVSWHVFGTGFTSVYAPLPVTKRFTYRDGVQKHDRHAQWNYVKSIVKLSDYGGYPQSPHSMKTNKKTAGSEKAWTDTNGKGNFDKIGAINYDRPVDVAVIHHYKYLSPKEFYWKSCVRKTVDDKFKDCNNAKPAKPYVGSVRDDSAWRTLKKNVPKYAMFDEFEDFM